MIRYCSNHRTIRKNIILFLSIVFVYNFLQFMPTKVFAAGIPITEYHTPSGAGAATSQGDYISATGGRNTFYSYFIEVPPGLAQMTVEVFDGNIKNTGGNTYDNKIKSANTFVTYSLINPSSVTVTSYTCGSGTSTPFCTEATWSGGTVTNPAAGHWEFRVDMSSSVTSGSDVNGFAIRAYVFPLGTGPELNIYADSFVVVGPHSGSNTYHLYPFITSGCTADSNDFDWDSSGSISFTSRTGAFTQNNPSVSGNDAWLNTPFSGWTTDFKSADYGIWNASLTLSAGLNYGTFYMGNFQAANPPPASQPQANTFRLYLPTDAGAAPVKPILTQTLSHASGPNPPSNGSTTRVRVQTTVFNPTPFSITFSASNLVTAYVPGSGAVYAGNASVTQGTIVSQPSVGNTGSITWNPGTVSAGTNVYLLYEVNVTPTSAGQRIPVTGTPLSNGTTAQYVDETGNTTQARATYLYGPLCELAATEGGTALPTLAVISSFEAYEENGRVVVQWETASEINTAGFYLFRKDDQKGEYIQINEKLLPGLLTSPQGGTYRYVDDTAAPGNTYTYKLVEVETKGHNRIHGPFTVTVGKQGINTETATNYLNYSRKAHDISDAKKSRINAGKLAGKAIRAISVNGKVKIALTENGLYYLDASEIATLLGTTSVDVQMMITNNQLLLTNQGQNVAYLSSSDNSGIYFYGQGINSIYTRENIYWLEKGSGLQMEVIGGAGPDPASGNETFTETIHFEEDHWAATSLFTDPQSDFWLWDYIVAGNPGLGSKTFNIKANGVASFSGSATLAVNLKGGTDTSANPDHHVVISLNGTKIGEDWWDGIEARTLELSFNQSLLNEGDNNVMVTGLLDTGAPYSIFYVDSFDLSYQRYYQAVNNRLFVRGDSNPVVTIEGFTDPAIFVFDVSNIDQAKLITAATVDHPAADNYRVSFRPASPESLYLALTINGLSTPVSLIVDNASKLKESNNSATYLVITPEELKDASQSLADYRQHQGLMTMVVELEDIMDEFNYGIYSPEAIRDFLSYAHHNWIKAPRYIVLAGEGTYDYKDNQRYGGNLIPPIMIGTPQGLFPSDNHFADIDGDHIPEMAIGRLPVVTSEELTDVIKKIMAYENTHGGKRIKQVLMLADNPDDGGDFPVDSNNVAALLPQRYTANKIYLSEHSIDEARQLILNGINTGALLLNYIGHGGLDRLAQEGMLLTSDVASMTNMDRLPVVTAMTCVVGNFSHPGYDSLSEVLVLKQNGGAVAVWSPAGMSINSEAVLLDEAFFMSTFTGRKQTLGDVVLKALEKGSMNGVSDYILDIYNIMGDPALKLK